MTKEITDIIQAFDAAQEAGRQCALATVVQLEGSAYRRPGARMLVADNGQLTGAISGGCLEGDALRKAQLVMQRQRPLLVTYDTTDDDESQLGVGLGCNGIIHILIEPVNTAIAGNPIALLKALLARRQEAVLVTQYSMTNPHATSAGTRMLLTGEQQLFSGTPDPLLLQDARCALNARENYTGEYHYGGEVLHGFIQWLQPAVSLIVIGAGNDVLPLVQMAAVMGWQVTVADGRRQYNTPQRFPQAHRLLTGKPAEVLQQLRFDAQTVVVLMTHNYVYDITMLKGLLQMNSSYTGILGPHKKTARMLEELQEQGMVITGEQLDHIYGPTGLDIGAETAEEIALSVLAEIKAALARRNGHSLRDKRNGIHEGKRIAINP